MHFYRSQETEARLYSDRAEIEANGAKVTLQLPSGRSRAAVIMLELTERERVTLGLPPCQANTGGTALCLVRADAADIGRVPLPAAPRSRDELVDAEVWPLQFYGLAAVPVDQASA